MKLVELDDNILFYIINHLKLHSIQNLEATCKYFYQLCNHNENTVYYVSFYQDTLTSTKPFSHSKFNRVHHFHYDDNIEILDVDTINQYWIDKSSQTKQMIQQMFHGTFALQHAQYFQQDNSDVIKQNCLDLIEQFNDETISNKLINEHWKNSIQIIEIKAMGNFFENKLLTLFPKKFNNLYSLKIQNLRNETAIIKKTFDTLIELNIKIRNYGSSGYNKLFDCILNCRHLQNLRITGNGRKDISDDQVMHLDWNEEKRKLSHLKSICILQMDITPKLCEFYEYLIVNTNCKRLELTFSPTIFLYNDGDQKDEGNSIGNLLLSSKIEMDKISSLDINILEIRCWFVFENLLQKLKQPHIIVWILFVLNYHFILMHKMDLKFTTKYDTKFNGKSLQKCVKDCN